MLVATRQANLGAEEWIRSIASKPQTVRHLKENLLQQLATDDTIVKNWDEAAQFLLALTAFDLSIGAKKDGHPSQKYLQELRQQLRFRSDADSPAAFDVSTFRATVMQWQKHPRTEPQP